MRLQSLADKFLLPRFIGILAAAAELGHALDEISKLRPVFVAGAGILTLSPATRSLAASASPSHLAGFLVGSLSFEGVELHVICFRVS